MQVIHCALVTSNGASNVLLYLANLALGNSERLERRPTSIDFGGLRCVEYRDELAVDLSEDRSGEAHALNLARRLSRAMSVCTYF